MTDLRDLLKRIRQWDALDIPDSDGAYWKREIDAALEQPEQEPIIESKIKVDKPEQATCKDSLQVQQPEQVDVLAEYTGDGTHRQWVSTGAWLMPGERVLHAGAGHPPRREWRGLTEEEINEATFHQDGRMNTHLEFARAIEAALKEKNL